MADRSIVVNLKANVSDFAREMGKAGSKLDDLVKKSGDAAGQSNTFLGRLAQSARHQSEAWTTTGTSIATAGAVLTGFNTLVAKTGIEYNTLQQKSRAALSTILGGAEQANRQMDKLDEFARTSPFSKAVFIQAQQQMLGFGIEAQKVIPYLSAINEAIAATGGNNNDLAEIVRVFSQIQAAGKITAVDLMQLGQRGIDAATLIGSQMGKTGAQIREDISSGALDAGAALDALAAGMQDRFEGASAGVKNTMEGAFDRVKAAWRDLSADFTSSAVGPNGGGWLVDLTNDAADFLRAVQKLPQPVKDTVAAMSGIAGASALAVGGFMVLVPKALEAVTAFKTLTSTFPVAAAAAGPAAVAFATVGAVIGAIASDIAEGKRAVEEYSAALAAGAQDSERRIREIAAENLASAGVAEELERVRIRRTLATDAAVGEAGARERLIAGYDREIERLRELATVEQNRGNFSEDYTNQAEQLIMSRDRVLFQIDREAEYLGRSSEQMENYNALVGQSIEQQQAWGDTVENYHREGRAGAEGHTEGYTGLADSIDKTTEEYQKYIDTLASGADAFAGIDSALTATRDKHMEVAQAMADATDSGKDSWQDFYDGVSVSLNEFLAQLEGQVAAQEEWAANMVRLAGRASQGLIDHLTEMGPEGAALVAELVDASDAELSRMEELYARSGNASASNFAQALVDAGPVMAALGRKMGDGAVREAAAEVAAGRWTLQDIIDRYNLEATIRANADPAIQAARNALARIEGMTATMSVTARIRTYHANGLNAPVATGGLVGDVANAYGLAGGGMLPKTYHYGGMVHGPGTPTSDDVAARLSRKEFVHRAAAVDYYGSNLMYALNQKRIPREYFAAMGFADGGSPGYAYQPQRVTTGTAQAFGGTSISTGDINVTVQGSTSDAMLEDFARQLPARIAQAGGRR